MAKIIGFESTLPNDKDAVTWSATAVDVGDKVVNSISHAAITKEAFSRYVQNGLITQPGYEIDINDRYLDSRFVAVILNGKSNAAKPLKLRGNDKNRLIVASKHGNLTFYVIEYDSEFEWYRESCRNRIAREIVAYNVDDLGNGRNEDITSEADEKLKAGLILCPHDPYGLVTNCVYTRQDLPR